MNVRKSFYSSPHEHTDLQTVVFKNRKNGAQCRYLFVSFPMGDDPMVMMIEAKHRLVRVLKQFGETQNTFRLFQTDPGSVVVTAHNAVEIMIDRYQAKDYSGVLDAFEKAPEAHEFSTFLGILATFRLSQSGHITSDIRGKYLAVLRTATQMYRTFHLYQNGSQSIQHAYASLLACFCLPVTEEDKEPLFACDHDMKYLPDSEKLFSLIRGNRYFDAARYEEAVCLYRTLPVCYYNQVLPRLVSKELWHHAFGFAFLLFKNNPCTANTTLFARCCYALGMKSSAIHYIGYENRSIMKTWPKSERRICEDCWRPGYVNDMICCTCQESWYCNVVCYAAFSRLHLCRVCAFCQVYISVKHPARCPQCYWKMYCSPKCQNRDWYENNHKGECK